MKLLHTNRSLPIYMATLCTVLLGTSTRFSSGMAVKCGRAVETRRIKLRPKHRLLYSSLGVSSCQLPLDKLLRQVCATAILTGILGGDGILWAAMWEHADMMIVSLIRMFILTTHPLWYNLLQ